MSAPATRIVGVSASVAGFSVVPEALLAKRLGPSAWHTWQVLAAKRDREGLTHITTLGIASARGFVALAHHKVRLALRTLVRVGLVENVGWKWTKVPVRGGTKSLRVFVRRVRGARLLTTEKGLAEVCLPRDVKSWALSPSRGGARAGAGRPRKAVPLPENVISIAEFRRSVERLEEVETGSAMGIQTRAARIQTRAARTEFKPALAIFKLNKATKDAVRTCVELGQDSSKEETRRGGGADRFSSSETEVGLSLGGALRRAPLAINTPIGNVPPYPGHSVVTPAEVPPPCKLTSEMSDFGRVSLLAALYRGAIEKLYRKRVHTLKNVSERAPSWQLLLRAAARLEEYDVAPAAWVTWAVRRWYAIRTHTGGWKEGDPVPLPPLKMVFSLSQIDKRCEDPEHRYVVHDSALGGRVVFGKTHKRLLRRYVEMRAALNRGGNRAEIVRRFFPGSTYDDMVDAARTEAVEIRSRLENDIKLGRIVW